MNNFLKNRRWTLVLACTIVLGIPACQNKSELDLLPTPTESQMNVLVDQVANSSAYQKLLTEAADASIKMLNKELVFKVENKSEFQRQLNLSQTKQELKSTLAKGFNRPELIISFAEKMNILLTELDAETHFSRLTTEKRNELMARASASSTAKKAFATAYSSLIKQVEISVTPRTKNSRARVVDCGGNCNTVYYHTIESAAANMAIAAAGSWALGMFGGPAGMMAGAGGIVIAGAAYLVAEHYALVSLGDCFDACME